MRPGRQAKRARQERAKDRLHKAITYVLVDGPIPWDKDRLARMRREYATLEDRTR